MTTGVADSETLGYVLLISAAPPGKYRAIDAGAALPRLAAVPPAVLLGTQATSTVQLADPVEPNTVLTHVRTAAASPGPLLVYVAGQVSIDRRQRLPHLALARTTTATLRYTALPWHWLAHELRDRPPGSTSVLIDLVAADPAAWAQLAADPRQLSSGLALYGMLAPPPAKRTTTTPLYSRALAEILRTVSARLPIDQLHQRAARQAGLGTGGEILFDGTPDRAASPPRPAVPVSESLAPPVAAPRPDPYSAIREAVRAGRHSEAATIAAAWEQAASRTGGPASPEAIHRVEVRADLAMLAGDTAHACELWMTAATVRLTSGHTPDDEAVIGPVDRAHHCWVKITDRTRAVSLAADLLELRRKVPGKQSRALEQLQYRPETLRAVRTG